MELNQLDQESRGLLKLIVEGQAYRQLVLCNIRGHGVGFLPSVESKLELVRALDDSLGDFKDVQSLYERLGHGDVVSAVRGKMDRVPYPESRMELAVCLFLCERVQYMALETFVESSCDELAEIARERLEANRMLDMPDDPAFLEFCADEGNQPRVQEIFNRWIGLTVLALGRRDNARDARVVELGLRSRKMSDVARDFVESLDSFRARCGLGLPAAETLGIEMPAEDAE
jgi:1,2-phenylacetyl-CoA epoxidase catalytic subunit